MQRRFGSALRNSWPHRVTLRGFAYFVASGFRPYIFVNLIAACS